LKRGELTFLSTDQTQALSEYAQRFLPMCLEFCPCGVALLLLYPGQNVGELRNSGGSIGFDRHFMPAPLPCEFPCTCTKTLEILLQRPHVVRDGTNAAHLTTLE
jgi:hypothetical protein